MFGKEIDREVQLYAKSQYPMEACGFIREDRSGVVFFEPQPNVAKRPDRDFQIPLGAYPTDGSLRAVFHSHTNEALRPVPSKEDMESQVATDVPWGPLRS